MVILFVSVKYEEKSLSEIADSCMKKHMSFLMSFSWGYLLYTGQVSTICPLFGSANQMLAAIALGIATTVMIKMGKAKYIG